MKMFNVVIIGLGNIGCLYDCAYNNDEVILTHSSAFHFHPNFKLIAGIDPDFTKRKKFEEKFFAPTYADIEDALGCEQVDIVVIAAPTHLHYDIFKKILLSRHKPKAIICEKPLEESKIKGIEMINEAEANGVALLVNYFRRFEPGFLQLKTLSDNNNFGRYNKAIIHYVKGFRHNASHYLDFLLFMFGPISDFKLISIGRSCGNDDAELDVKIRFKNGVEASFFSHKVENYSIGEINLYSDKAVVHCSREKGIMIFWAKPDPLLPNYMSLSPDPVFLESDFKRYQWYVVEHLYQHLVNNRPLNSSGLTALETLITVNEIIKERNQLCQMS